MKRRREKGRRKTALCTNLKQTSADYGVALCGVWGNAGKNAIYKRRTDEFINVSHFFIKNVSRFIATFVYFKKRKKVLLYFGIFYLSIVLDSP